MKMKYFNGTLIAILILISLTFAVSNSNAQFAAATIPFLEIQKVQGNTPVGERGFGATVSISGKTAIIGAFRDNSLLRGRAFIFERNDAGFWSETQVLTASDSEDRDFFGNSVSISADMAIVGASQTPFPPPSVPGPGKVVIYEKDVDGVWIEVAILVGSDAVRGDTQGLSSDIDGINGRAIMGSPRPPFSTFEGKGYIFERDPMGNWNEAAILTASDASTGDFFANKVSINGDTAMSAAPFANQVYVFERDKTGNWNETQILTASDAMPGDFFGSDVVHRGDRMIVGAQSGDMAEGKAYIFERDELGIWNEVQILTPSSPITNEIYGSNVSISGDLAVVGATFPQATAGRAYLYQRDESGFWAEISEINPSDGMPNDQFGVEVSIDRNQMIIGAQGVNGDRGEDFLGAAYFFGGPTDLNIDVVDDGIGSGTVISLPTGIDCGGIIDNCAKEFPYQTIVALRAIPNPDSVFVGWSGDCSGENRDITVFLIDDSICVAEFEHSDSDFVLNPLVPAIDNSINIISADNATPGGKVALVWGFHLGMFTLGGNTCTGTELGIRKPRLLGIVFANQSGTATYSFFIPAISFLDFEVHLQAIDIETCQTSNIVSQIIRKKGDE